MMDYVFSYCSWIENEVGSNIIDFVDRHRRSSIPARQVDNFFRDNHINYHELPQYLKDKIDELNVY